MLYCNYILITNSIINLGYVWQTKWDLGVKKIGEKKSKEERKKMSIWQERKEEEEEVKV